MSSFEEIFGRVLAEARREANLSQEALAFRCKLHPTYISQLERGVKSPTIRALRAIARALDTTGAEVLYRAERVAGEDSSESSNRSNRVGRQY